MRVVSLLVVVGLVVLGAACGGDGDDDVARQELTASLGFLRTEYGLDAAQVRCVVAEIEADLGAGDLDELAVAMRSIDDGRTSIDDLESDQERVLTQALESCAAVSG